MSTDQCALFVDKYPKRPVNPDFPSCCRFYIFFWLEENYSLPGGGTGPRCIRHLSIPFLALRPPPFSLRPHATSVPATAVSLELFTMEGKRALPPDAAWTWRLRRKRLTRLRPRRTPPLRLQRCHAALRGHVASPAEFCMLCVNYLSPVPEPTRVFNLRFRERPNLCGQVGPE